MALSTVNGHSLPTNGNWADGTNAEKEALTAAVRIMAEAINTSGGVDASVTEGSLEVDSTSATAFTVTASDATINALTVNTNTASTATGLTLTPAAESGGVAVAVVSSGTNENLKLDAKGSGTIDLNTTATGTINVKRDLTMADGKNIVVNTTTGTKFASAADQKLGFWGVTAVVQPAAAGQASITVESASLSGYGFSTAAQADSIVTLLLAIRTALVNCGIMKGAA